MRTDSNRSSLNDSKKEKKMETVDFGLMPASMGCVSTPASEDRFYPMIWSVSSEGLLSVVDPPPLSEVYLNQHADPSVSQVWLDHHKRFSQFLVRSFSGKAVLEIGGGTGLLAEIATAALGEKVHWQILEPFFPEVLPSSERVTWVKGWFPKDAPQGGHDVIVATHVLEHTTDPPRFIQDCSDNLELGGELFLSWPDMDEMAKRGDLNMLNFEHLNFLPVESVRSFLASSGLAVETVENFRNHSIFIRAVKREGTGTQPLGQGPSRKRLMELARSYRSRLDSLVAKMNQEIEAWPGEISVFGAHIFTQYLIARGLDASRISQVLDNSKFKLGKRLYGTNLIVHSPDELISKSGQLILVAAALYEEEITQQLRQLGLKDSRIVTSRTGTFNLQ